MQTYQAEPEPEGSAFESVDAFLLAKLESDDAEVAGAAGAALAREEEEEEEDDDEGEAAAAFASAQSELVVAHQGERDEAASSPAGSADRIAAGCKLGLASMVAAMDPPPVPPAGSGEGSAEVDGGGDDGGGGGGGGDAGDDGDDDDDSDDDDDDDSDDDDDDDAEDAVAEFVAAQAELASVAAVGSEESVATAAQAAGAARATKLQAVAADGATSSTAAAEVAGLAVGSSLELGGGSPPAAEEVAALAVGSSWQQNRRSSWGFSSDDGDDGSETDTDVSTVLKSATHRSRAPQPQPPFAAGLVRQRSSKIVSSLTHLLSYSPGGGAATARLLRGHRRAHAAHPRGTVRQPRRAPPPPALASAASPVPAWAAEAPQAESAPLLTVPAPPPRQAATREVAVCRELSVSAPTAAVRAADALPVQAAPCTRAAAAGLREGAPAPAQEVHSSGEAAIHSRRCRRLSFRRHGERTRARAEQ